MRKVLLALLLSGLLPFVPPAWAVRKILIVHSYHQEDDRVQSVNAGMEKHLAPLIAESKVFYMDTKRRPSKQWKATAGQMAKDVIGHYQPDVLIAVDDNAQLYCAKDYAGRQTPQIVFCAINADPEAYGYPARNVTGILERTYPRQTLQLLKRILPSVDKVAYISDDSTTGDLVTPQMKRMADEGILPVELIGFERPSTFEAWKQAIGRYSLDRSVDAFLIPLYHTVREKAGETSLAAGDVMAWTVYNTSKPVVGYWPFSPDDGALCAVGVDPRQHGEIAALMAKQILEGTRAGDIPVVTNVEGLVIINLKTAERLGIEVPFHALQSADKIIE